MEDQIIQHIERAQELLQQEWAARPENAVSDAAMIAAHLRRAAELVERQAA